MLPQIQTFNQLASRVIIDQTQRSRVIAAAVATAVASQGNLPTAPVDSPAVHFASVELAAIKDALSMLNEEIVFDCKQAIEWARALWLVRYGAAHPIARPIFASNYSFFESVCGVPVHVAPDAAFFMNENKTAICALAQQAGELLAVLMKVTRGDGAVRG